MIFFRKQIFTVSVERTAEILTSWRQLHLKFPIKFAIHDAMLQVGGSVSVLQVIFGSKNYEHKLKSVFTRAVCVYVYIYIFGRAEYNQRPLTYSTCNAERAVLTTKSDAHWPSFRFSFSCSFQHWRSWVDMYSSAQVLFDATYTYHTRALALVASDSGSVSRQGKQ